MKRFLVACLLLIVLPGLCLAQQAAAGVPASKEDVERYFEVMHSRQMMAQMVENMSKPMHRIAHEEYEKNKDKLPPDFEAQMNRSMEDALKGMPYDEMLEAMVPAYQKHFTKSDLDALTAFYGSPTGQKVLRELPAIMGEGMAAVMPLMRKHVDALSQQMQQQMADAMKASEKKPDKPGSKAN